MGFRIDLIIEIKAACSRAPAAAARQPRVLHRTRRQCAARGVPDGQRCGCACEQERGYHYQLGGRGAFTSTSHALDTQALESVSVSSSGIATVMVMDKEGQIVSLCLGSMSCRRRMNGYVPMIVSPNDIHLMKRETPNTTSHSTSPPIWHIPPDPPIQPPITPYTASPASPHAIG